MTTQIRETAWDDPAAAALRQSQRDELAIRYETPDSEPGPAPTAAARILHTLEEWARDHGWDRLLLETGDRQPDAIRFYEREGYVRIPNFGHYTQSTISLCFEHRLG